MSDLDILDEFLPWDDRPAKARKKNRWRVDGSLQTHCFRGHEFTAENTIINSVGARVCRKCKRLYYQSNKGRWPRVGSSS